MADDLLQRLGAAAIQKLPLPLQQSMRGVTFRGESGPTQSIASGSQQGNLAGVIPGQNVINVMDPAAFQKAPEQLAAHEGMHIWQNNLPPTIRAQMPPDDPKNPYQVWDTNRVAQLLARGGTPANMPSEQASATAQYYQAQGGDKSAPQVMRDTYGKLIQTMPTVPESTIMPTDPNQQGINTTPRPPRAPMMMSQKTYAKGQPPDSDPPPPAGYTVDNDPAPPAGYTLDAPTSTGPAPAPAGNTLSAAPAPSWGQQLTEDLQQGGSRTVVGRTLGHMQGRGDQGYTGLESGVSPGAADYVGSPFLGTARAIAGAQEIPQHPLKGMWDTGKGLLQAATLPLTFAGGPVADEAIQAIPSAKAAGKMFDSVMADAGDLPVTLQHSMNPLERTQQLASRGAAPIRVADQLFQRVNTVNPMTYKEGRDFASNISSLSAGDKMNMNGPMKSAVGELRGAFHQDLANTADTVGRGQDYLSAVQEYARAMGLRDTARNVGLFAVKKALPLAGAAGGAAYEAHKLLR